MQLRLRWYCASEVQLQIHVFCSVLLFFALLTNHPFARRQGELLNAVKTNRVGSRRRASGQVNACRAEQRFRAARAAT